MINVSHYTSEHGWEFVSDSAGLHGGGRTLSASVAASEHAARRHLSGLRGVAVPLDRARKELRHTTGATAPAEDVAA